MFQLKGHFVFFNLPPVNKHKTCNIVVLTKKWQSKCEIGFHQKSTFFDFFKWDPLHARLSILYEAYSYRKKKDKNIKPYRMAVLREPTDKRGLSFLDLKRSKT